MEQKGITFWPSFDPRILLRHLPYFTVGSEVEGEIKSDGTKTCIVCRATIREGYLVSIDNGGNDIMHVGVCCCSHDREQIKNSAVEKAIFLMDNRKNELLTLDRKQVEISNNE
jgi:hypothetical protein